MIPTAFRHSKSERVRGPQARVIEAREEAAISIPGLDGDGVGKASRGVGLQFGHQFPDGLSLLLLQGQQGQTGQAAPVAGLVHSVLYAGNPALRDDHFRGWQNCGLQCTGFL